MKKPLLAIPRRIINISKIEIIRVLKTILQGDVVVGEQQALFAVQFARYIGTKYAFTFSSGRAALRVILRSLCFPKGSEIIMPAYTDESVPWTIIEEGLKPIFADIRKEDFNIDYRQIEGKINKNTKAVIVAHIFGSICDIPTILEICKKNNIVLIEDCAHAPGAILDGKRVGSFGVASFFSFNSTKYFHAYGGGCVVTDDEALADKIRDFSKSCGVSRPAVLFKEIILTWLTALCTSRIVFTFLFFPIFVISKLFSSRNDLLLVSYNRIIKKLKNSSKDIRMLSNLQSKIALHRLGTLEWENKKRIDNVVLLRKCLKSDVLRRGIESKNGSIYYFYIINVKNINELSRKLLYSGIDTGKYLMRNVARLYGDKSSYPVTGWAYEHSLQIPIFGNLDEQEIKYIAEVLNKNFK